MNHKEVAEDILKMLGEDNIQAAAHCATRLRIVLKDDKNIDQQGLDDHPDIKGTFKSNGQFQIIIGPGDVNKVYKELTDDTGIQEVSKDNLKGMSEGKKKQNPIMSFIKLLSDIFVPIIPALVAGGLLMALNNVLTSPDLFGPQSVVEMFPAIEDIASIINLLASAPFAFLPILIGYSATKRFGGNPYLGAAMAMAMVMPDLVNGYAVANAIEDGTMSYWNIFGLDVAQAGYQGSVLPVLAVSWILANIEKFFHKRMANAFDFTFTPMLAVIITGFITFIFVGPVMRSVSDGLTEGLVWLYEATGGFGLGLFGTFYSAIVITGLHQSFPAIETMLLADIDATGGSFIFPVASMANVAQGAACLAVFLVTKNKKQKGLASSASVSAMLGITEPAIFGVNLKLKFPFICGMIGAGIASAFIGFFNVLAVAMGPASVIGFISIAPRSIPMFMVGILISMTVAFTLTFIYGKRKLVIPEYDKSPEESANETSPAVSSSKADEVTISSPLTGKLIPLQDVNDQVFSSEMMGKGIAIYPENQQIVAPADGKITVTYDSKHAFGIHTDQGAEILIHIGIDTVNLNGEGFVSKVSKEQLVKKGDILGTFNIDKIKKAGYDPTVMVIITNTGDYAEVSTVNQKEIAEGDDLLRLR
ncbi:PTS beta-glucoside transporter subunit EIIBCA [Virgibacillus profundi]|uniref:protein-N(pi)-phosphohistidine--sucrose phosphotransferase n=1 Tax=Virgibacillus profundi TaxID=2024555 RepID=A0A2A2IAL4_9BACI|nr:sucrose-specific PTS transporter subunit IIBC [Virgibacillus profundi]PAV28324.1 PTS beta-glucoside transporter subunit EIIBCA [Virgibacillus profundi]PXY52314.1 PTS beta-glucoside transporter subunit IIBCA [Virgibacillus profundi]